MAVRSTRDDAIEIVRKLRDAGHVAYLAGGCVRDELLGIAPKDYDVATDAPPDRVRSLFRNTQAVGAAFGVILVRIGGSQIEVATFRSDGTYVDGRHPTTVRFSDAREDAQRRDFTINGMFLDPLTNEVIDHVGGREDLAAKRLRAIGKADARFAEDHLRMLRAVRFAARFDLDIEPDTRRAIMLHAQELARISPERIADELRRMLTPVTRARAWTLLEELGLDDVLLRFVQPPVHGLPHPTTRAHRKQLIFPGIDPGHPIAFGLALAGCHLEYLVGCLPHLGDLAAFFERLSVRELSKAARQAFKISNDETETFEGTLYGVWELLTERELREARLKRFLARPTANMSRALLAAIPIEVGGVHHREQLAARLNELEKTDFAPTPFITGDDLTAAGFAPGPVFKRILDQVYDAQLEDRVRSKEDAMALARSLV